MYVVCCNNAGALFVSASCDSTLQELMPPPGLAPSRQMDVLPLARMLRMPIELRGFAGRPGQHLLGVAALQLAGGGTALMLLLPHALADLASSRQFVRDWSAIARQLQAQAGSPGASSPGGSPRDAAERGQGGAGAPAFGWQRFDALADAGEGLEAAMTPTAARELLPTGPALVPPEAGGVPLPQQRAASSSSAPAAGQAGAPHASLSRRWWAISWLLLLLVAILRQLQVWASSYSPAAADTLQAALRLLRQAGGPSEPPCPGAQVWPCTRVGSRSASSSPSSSGGGCKAAWRFRSHLASRYRDPLKYLLARASLLWHARVTGVGDALFHISAARLAELKGEAQADLVAAAAAAAAIAADAGSWRRPAAAAQLAASSGQLSQQPQQGSSIGGGGIISTNDALAARIWQVGAFSCFSAEAST
jgi:hypothetical protein